MTSPVLRDKAVYMTLVDRFPLIPIRNEKHLAEAIAVVNELIDKKRRAPEEEEYLNVLSDLIEKFEEEHFPVEPSSPAEMLRFLMESNGLRQADLAPLFSSKSNLSEVLAGRRQLSKAQIVKLAKYFHVFPALFLTVE